MHGGRLAAVVLTCACMLVLVLILQAMAALDEKHLIEGSTTPLAVKWADPMLQIKKRRAVEDSNAENRMVRRSSGRGSAASLTPSCPAQLCHFLGLHPEPQA